MTSITNGQCPHCESRFDAQTAIVAFPANFKSQTICFVFALCPDCFELLKLSNDEEKIAMIKSSYQHVVKNPSEEWTLITNLALLAYQGDFFNAWWQGLNLPLEIYETIDRQMIDEIVLLPFGRVICK